jgi:uncharacterized Ntn-hydrolase superfamily protein
MKLSTFSIAARCEKTGMIGIAISTAVPAVGGICTFVKSGVGAVATQSWVNPYLGIEGLKLLENGHSASEVLEQLLDGDEGRSLRQLGVVDVHGGSAAFTGDECVDWCGNINGPGFSIQGNMLTGEETLGEMTESYRSTTEVDFPERLVAALEAGQSAGGDKRGRQSAYLRIFSNQDYPYLMLGVDDHDQPVAELRRVFEVAKKQYLPFGGGLPTKEEPLRKNTEATVKMLMKSPRDR